MKKIEVYLAGKQGAERLVGEGRCPKIDQIHTVATESGIQKQRMTEIIEEVSSAAKQWPVFADQAGLCRKTTVSLADTIRPILN